MANKYIMLMWSWSGSPVLLISLLNKIERKCDLITFTNYLELDNVKYKYDN